MDRRKFLSLAVLTLPLGLAFAGSNNFIVPDTVNPRLRMALGAAELIKKRGIKKVAVVFMEESQLCAIFAAALVVALKDRGIKSWYLEGGKGLSQRIKETGADYVYMAYFGELPEDKVQEALDSDLLELAEAKLKVNLIFHPSTVSKGFVNNTVFDESISSYLKSLKGVYAVIRRDDNLLFAKASEISDLGVSFKELIKVKYGK